MAQNLIRWRRSDYQKLSWAVRKFNEKIKELQDNYAVRDKQDLLSMCVLQYASGMIKAERNAQQHEDGLEEKVHELDGLLTDFFSK